VVTIESAAIAAHEGEHRRQRFEFGTIVDVIVGIVDRCVEIAQKHFPAEWCDSSDCIPPRDCTKDFAAGHGAAPPAASITRSHNS
jgi:hypothetical protein